MTVLSIFRRVLVGCVVEKILYFMGCNICKTTTVIPMTTSQKEEYLLDDVAWTEQQDTIMQETSLPLLQSTMNQTDIHRKSSSKSNKSIRQSQCTRESPLNDSNEVTAFQATITRPTSTKTIKSNVRQEIISNTSSSVLNKRNSHDEMDARLTSASSNEVVMRRKTASPLVIESIDSYIEDDNISNRTLMELDESHPNYDDIASLSLSTNTEKIKSRQGNYMRLKSAKPKKYNAQQDIFINDTYSDSDESYPIHNSIITSSSSDCEELSMKNETIDHRTLTGTPKLEVQQNILADEISNELDKTNQHFETINSPISSDSEEIAMHQEAVIESKSPNLTKSDTNQKTIVYETSSDSDDS